MVAAVTVRKDGKAEMAYVGEKPWHGLGEALVPGADIATWQKAAGMDWKIQRSVVRYAADRDAKVMLEMPDKHVLFRSDTKAALGMVSDKYKVVQPGDVLEFFRDLTEVHGYELSTAGTLFDGKRFWALASVGEERTVAANDKVGGYLLLSTSCDGSLATEARFTAIRVVCNNTLTMALNDGSQHKVVIRHSSQFDQEQTKAALGLAKEHYSDFMDQMVRLADFSITHKMASDFVATLLTDTKTVYKEDPTKSRQHQKIIELFDGQAKGAKLDGVQGTAWGLVNSVTEFVDHHARTKTDAARLASAWFGRGDQLKTEALTRALKLVA